MENVTCISWCLKGEKIMDIIEQILRLVIAFSSLLILTKIMGRKEISEMTFINFVSGIALGTMGASLAVNSAVSIRNGVIALISWSTFTVILGFVDIKSKKAREVLQGKPVILVKNGQILEHEMRKVRLDIDELTALLRQKDVFSITEVDFAIFETDGRLSVMKKENQQPLTKGDMNIATNKPVFPIPTEVIADGRIISANLKNLNTDEHWLREKILHAGNPPISSIFYAEVQKDGSLYLDLKKDYLPNK